MSLELLRVIGSPFFTKTGDSIDKTKVPELYSLAVRNRMPLLFLDTLNRRGSLGDLEATYHKSNAEYLETYDAILRAATVLEKAGIGYALFKTLRPYPATTVDIDTIVFGSARVYEEAIDAMVDAGYRLLGSGPWSTTVEDPLMDIGVDLYREVAVSRVIYLDKANLAVHVTRKELPNGEFVRTLSPAADLVSLLAHSVIKEQMYTLSEYYSFLLYLSDMNSQEVSAFGRMVRDNAISRAAASHITLSGILHEAAYGEGPGRIRQLLLELREDSFEKKRFVGEHFKTPHKFHPLTVMKALREKVSKDKKTKRSLSDQMVAMLDPGFAQEVLTRLARQYSRETY